MRLFCWASADVIINPFDSTFRLEEHELPNFCPKDFGTRSALTSMRE
jgi:hypothetical protein